MLNGTHFYTVIEGDEVHSFFDFLISEENKMIVAKDTIINRIAQVV